MPVGQRLDRRVYGRDQHEWDELTRVGWVFLSERARLRKTTSYTELSATLTRRTGLRGFDFDRVDERAAMGHLLGLIVESDFRKTGLMISALVIYLNENDAGSGFYGLAQQYGLLRAGATSDEKLIFWANQVKELYARAAPEPARRAS